MLNKDRNITPIKQVMVKMKKAITTKYLVMAFLALILFIMLAWLYKSNVSKEEELRQVKILTAEQATNINALQNKLKVSKEQAEKLTEKMAKAQEGQSRPVEYITVVAPSVDKAVENTKERLEAKDPTLPPSALEKSDRTVVAPQVDNEEYKVGIYKINLNKDNKIKAGMSYIDNKHYYNLAYERKKLEVTLHSRKLRAVDGVTVMYTVASF